MRIDEAIAARRSVRAFDDRPIHLDMVNRILQAGQGTTGRNGERTVPSAHALYPLRLFLVAGRIEGLASGVYGVRDARGATSALIARDIRGDLEAAALDDQPWIGRAAGIVTVCADAGAASDAFMDQPPYGFRGLRYAHMEAGAMLQTMQLHAVGTGLASVIVAGFRDEATAAALRLDPPLTPLGHLCFGWPAGKIADP